MLFGGVIIIIMGIILNVVWWCDNDCHNSFKCCLSGGVIMIIIIILNVVSVWRDNHDHGNYRKCCLVG
jgi:hypothetical protein